MMSNYMQEELVPARLNRGHHLTRKELIMLMTEILIMHDAPGDQKLMKHGRLDFLQMMKKRDQENN